MSENPDKVALAAAAEAVEVPPAPPVPNAAVVARTFKEDGSVEVSLQILGDVRITELPTLLRKGAMLADKQLGV